MCISVYLSTDLEVEAVPFSQIPPDGSPHASGHFRVCFLHDKDEFVRAFFSKHNVYYLASHEDCGCGFEWDAKSENEYPEAWEKEWETLSDCERAVIGWTPEDQRKWFGARQRTAQDLEELLTRLLRHTDEVEIGVFDDPECQGAWSARRVVTPSDLSRGQPNMFPVVGVLYKVLGRRPNVELNAG